MHAYHLWLMQQSDVTPPPPFILQVLCCEVEGLLTQLLGDESIMDLLFSLLQQVADLSLRSKSTSHAGDMSLKKFQGL